MRYHAEQDIIRATRYGPSGVTELEAVPPIARLAPSSPIASNDAVCPGAAPAVPAADPHPAGHPWLPTDTTLLACSPTWSKAPDTGAGTHTYPACIPARPSPAPPPLRSDRARSVDTVH